MLYYYPTKVNLVIDHTDKLVVQFDAPVVENTFADHCK